MSVDKLFIRLFAWDGTSLHGPITQLSTTEVLSPYDPNFMTREIYQYHLENLVAGWLDDLLYGWKFENPPGKMVLAQTGLINHLKKPGTAMRTEVALQEMLTAQRN